MHQQNRPSVMRNTHCNEVTTHPSAAIDRRDSNIAGVIDLLQTLATSNVDHGVNVAGTNI